MSTTRGLITGWTLPQLDDLETRLRGWIAEAEGEGNDIVVEWLQKKISEVQEERASRSAEAEQSAAH